MNWRANLVSAPVILRPESTMVVEYDLVRDAEE